MPTLSVKNLVKQFDGVRAIPATKDTAELESNIKKYLENELGN